jgi:hypothetical protein
VADLLYFGSKGVYDYYEDRELVKYAKGATPAIGEDMLAEAELSATPWYQAAIGILAPGLGAISGVKQLRALRNAEAVERGAALARRVGEFDERTMARLTDAERRDLAALYTELQAKRLKGGSQALDDAEKASLAKFDDYFNSGSGKLRQGLPDDLSHLPIEVDDALPGRTVRVSYETDANGVVRNVKMVAGNGATEADIALHAQTVRDLQKYEGLAGRARNLADKFSNAIGRRKPPPGSTAFEAEAELRKLPGVIEDRLNQLKKTDLDPSVVDDLNAEVDYLQAQLRHHERNLAAWDLNPGRGFVAADAPPKVLIDEFQRAEAAVTGSSTKAIRQSTDGSTAAVSAAELRKPLPNSRYSANGYLYATDAEGRVTRAEGNLRLDPAPRNTTQQSEVGRAGASRPDGYVYGKSDDGGHLIGSRFNGAGEAINMLPQNSALNQNGLWKQLENTWAAELEKGSQVRVRIEPHFEGTAIRPDRYDVHYIVTPPGGTPRPVTTTILNTATGM